MARFLRASAFGGHLYRDMTNFARVNCIIRKSMAHLKLSIVDNYSRLQVRNSPSALWRTNLIET